MKIMSHIRIPYSVINVEPSPWIPKGQNLIKMETLVYTAVSYEEGLNHHAPNQKHALFRFIHSWSQYILTLQHQVVNAVDYLHNLLILSISRLVAFTYSVGLKHYALSPIRFTVLTLTIFKYTVLKKTTHTKNNTLIIKCLYIKMFYIIQVHINTYKYTYIYVYGAIPVYVYMWTYTCIHIYVVQKVISHHQLTYA